MKNSNQAATAAQAKAVRDYLSTLGVALTHVQALEVIARGQGARSRHLLAQSPGRGPAPAANKSELSQGEWTRVAYSYADGSNCKRHSSLTFRGKLHASQLALIADRLDDGLYFVPAQVGFESLQFAFSDLGAEDHGWHKLELGPRESWTLDSEGYILSAGDVQRVSGVSLDGATDADTENLFWRFCRVQKWDEELQIAALTGSVHAFAEHAELDEGGEQAERNLKGWLTRFCESIPADVASSLAGELAALGFAPDGAPNLASRIVGPNAIQSITLSPVDDAQGLELSLALTTLDGARLAEPASCRVGFAHGGETVWRVEYVATEQAKAVRFKALAYGAQYA